MAVVVEPVLGIEKLRELLAEGHEQPCLDYKQVVDLNERRDVVELTKDIAAMQAEELGGYIVVGADDHGKVVPDLTPQLAVLFDEASLRGKLKRYIAEPFTVLSARHTVDGKEVVLLYVAPNPEGWCIFAADGEYEQPPGKRVARFRVGEVFVRHGTASERWQDSDRRRLVAQLIARRKEAWRAEFRAELAAMNIGLNVRQIEQMPSSAVTWKIDADGFDELVTELIRRDDDIPLRRMLQQARHDAAALLVGDVDDLPTLLDRVTSVSALGLAYQRQAWVELGVQALEKIYELGFDNHGVRRNDIDAARLWLQAISRVYALGGLAVRIRQWNAVRDLATRTPAGRDFGHYASWLRHAQVMASRGKILDDKDDAGLIARAHNVVRTVGALHPDLPADSEQILDSLCQFDALAGLVVIGERGRPGSSGAHYPNFSRYYTHRTEPAFILVVTDQSARQTLFQGDDNLLAAAIYQMDQTAQREGFNYDGWEGIDDERVRRFLTQHAPTQRVPLPLGRDPEGLSAAAALRHAWREAPRALGGGVRPEA